MTTVTLVGCDALLGETLQRSAGPVDIVIRDGRIDAIRASGSAATVGVAIDSRRRLAVPGLINGHHHSHEHFHKGRYDRLPLELWMNFVRPPAPLPLTPRQVYLRTMIGALQALRSGTTCLVDDLNANPLSREHVEAALQAYRDSGLRALVGPTLFDLPFFRSVPFIDEELPADQLAGLQRQSAPPVEELLAYVRELARDHHPRRHRVGCLLAPSAPQRCSDALLQRVGALADELELPVIIHVHETRLQVVTGQLRYGGSMVAHLHRVGLLRPGTSLIHAVWLTPEDIALIAAAGASVQHNPNSNLKLGSGLAPLRALLDAGVNVSLGSDGCGSIDSVDMLRVVANTALVHKLRGDDHRRWIGADEALRAATVGGARALGLGEELGALAPGRQADIALYRLDSIAFTPLNDPLRQLVYGETGGGLDSLLIAGEFALRHGRPCRVDEAALLAEIEAAHAELAPCIEHAEAAVAALQPAYERIHARCRQLPVSPRLYPTRLADGPGPEQP